MLKITYATLSADNEELQTAFDKAVVKVKKEWLGAELPMFINGQKVYAGDKFKTYSPINTDILIATVQNGSADHSQAAVAAAKAARKAWQATPWQERVATIRAIAEKISHNIFDLSALMSFEVGKSRLEALGEVEETADLLRWYADSMEKNNGFVKEMGKLNPNDPTENNYSVLKPYGVWVVISPFNFPMALSAAPVAAALVTGNTVVYKGALETPYCDWKVAELFAEANLPAGVFNSVIGPDETVGQTLLDHPDVNGWTFTGSYQVGMKVLRNAANGLYPKPAVIEMGGKNPTIVSKTADLDKAAMGVLRAAFGLSGQKCSACSRVYVQDEVYEPFKQKLVELTRAVKLGDPTERNIFMGPVAHREGYEKYKQFMVKAKADGQVLAGGNVLSEGDFAKGYFVEPTVVENLPEDHELVTNELFTPILHLARVKTLDEAMEKANNTAFGLTAGFFGEDENEARWFLDNIQAGTVYTNRASGATTGAWPGVQAFGGWKGSGSTGKGVGAMYSLLLYMHEQSQTVIG
jgi:1-pyrroline-5-carboxylate dehydrogenase